MSVHEYSTLGLTRCNTTTSACSLICYNCGREFNPYFIDNTTFYGPRKATDPTFGTFQ